MNEGRVEDDPEAAGSVIEAIGTASALAGMITLSVSAPTDTLFVGEGGVPGLFPRFLGDEVGEIKGF